VALHRVDLLVIGFYFALLTAFGLLIRRTRGFEDFAIARRSVPTIMVFASLCGAYIGPGYSLGFAAKAYSVGFMLLPVWMCFSVQTCLVGIWLAPRLRKYPGAYTLGGVMMSEYGPIARQLTGVVSVGLCVGFAGVLARAGGVILSDAVGVPLPVAVFLITGVGVIYALTGGLKSVVATEGIQFGVVLVSAGAVVAYASHHISSYSLLDHTAFTLTTAAWKSASVPELLGMVLLFLLGETLIPPYANRALAAASDGASRLGFVLAGVFSVIWFALMATAGVMSNTILGHISQPDGVLIQLAQAVLPAGLLGLFLVALAAIVMSTQESLLNAASVCLTRDLMPSSWLDQKQLYVARVSTILFAIAAAWLGLRAPGILDGLLICYSIWAPTILPPLIWSLVGLPTSRTCGTLAILGGGLASGTVLVFHVASGNPAIAILAGLSASMLGGVIGLLAQRLWRQA
jgi:solute:Na+ symporter, SSS family